MEEGLDEVLAEEYDRAQVLDAALDLVAELKNQSSAIRAVLDQARDDAHEAMRALVKCDPNQSEEIRRLQWQVSRFDDLCSYVFNILEAGKVASEDMTAEELALMQHLIKGDDIPQED